MAQLLFIIFLFNIPNIVCWLASKLIPPQRYQPEMVPQAPQPSYAAQIRYVDNKIGDLQSVLEAIEDGSLTDKYGNVYGKQELDRVAAEIEKLNNQLMRLKAKESRR